MNELKPRDIQHQVDDLVITCMDHRFQRTFGHILKDEYQVDIESSDRVSYPGASKAVADGTLIPAIQTSHRLHDIKNVWLVDHTDCGGFGGLESHDNDEHKETEVHLETLVRAREAIHKVLPELLVTVFVVTLSGDSIEPPTNLATESHRQLAVVD